jgi:T6SS, Phospholipase effector Tle1-like, catalytic domain
MAKNIVFCADGTWNGPGEADSDDQNASWTNVFKLFLNLAGVADPRTTKLAKEQEQTLIVNGAVRQVAKYLHGVGDSTNLLARLIGGGFGAGLITRVVRGYTFVSRNYEPGDKIYLVGFSRGAYTVRALAGLISAKGLLGSAAVDFDNKDAAYRAGAAVWYQWRHAVLAAQGHPRHLEEIVLDLPGFLQQPPAPASLVAAPIEAAAVWDTVGALGIPVFTGQHVAVDLFQFADTALSNNVRFGRHAVSIDEQRGDFTPTLWDPDPSRIVQMLFAGAHADVGGGYPVAHNESGLSDNALQWMTDELRALGVLFAASPVVVAAPDAMGTAHRPWEHSPWNILPRASRSFPRGLSLAKSTLDRIAAGLAVPDPGSPAAVYDPTNLPDYLRDIVVTRRLS